MGTLLLLKKRQSALPQFSAHVYCGQTAGFIRIPSAPPLKWHSPPKFSTHVRCGQTAGWTKMPLGMKVGRSPGDVVLDGDLAAPLKGAHPSVFGPCLLWPNGWMDEDATWYGSKPRPRPHCVIWRPSSPSTAHHSSPALFSAHVYCGRPCQLLLSSYFVCV